MPLIAHIDDSGTHGGSVFVLAGFVSTAERWAALADDWAEVLANPVPRPLRYFKMTEAVKCRVEFHGFTVAQRDRRLCELYALIEKHVMWSVSVVIDWEMYKRENRYRPDFLRKHPYYFAVSALMSDVARNQKLFGLSEKVDFIFDEDVMRSGRILNIWEGFKRGATLDTRDMIGGTPQFKSDMDVLPLQAADMEAWWMRQRWHERLTGAPRLEYPWQPEVPIPNMEITFTQQRLREGYIATLNRLSVAPPYFATIRSARFSMRS